MVLKIGLTFFTNALTVCANALTLFTNALTVCANALTSFPSVLTFCLSALTLILSSKLERLIDDTTT